MALKNHPALHLQKMHAHAYGDVVHKHLKWESSAETADDTIKLLPLQPGMRIDSVIAYITDVEGSATTADVGYLDPADTDGDGDDGSDQDFWHDGIDLNTVGRHVSTRPPWHVTKKGMYLTITPKAPIEAETKMEFVLEYVFVGK